jgi:secreted Zn-dependent insulinase-like peptidase
MCRIQIITEFNLALPSDYHRKKQLLGSFAKKDHPANKFPWGNVATLGGNAGDDQEKKDTEIHARLHEFRKSNYIAQHMALALQSRHDLDTLQEWVIQCFGDVPSGSVSSQGEKSSQYPEKPFDTPEFRQFYKVLPVKDICQVIRRKKKINIL